VIVSVHVAGPVAGEQRQEELVSDLQAAPPPRDGSQSAGGADSLATGPAGADTDVGRVLVVDDNLAIHADFRKILSSEDRVTDALDALDEVLFARTTPRLDLRLDVDTALQGAEALELVIAARAQDRPYALAFIDIRMPPGWNGVDTAARILQRDPHLQLVLCTAHSDYRWEDIVTTLGGTDRVLILKKPFSVLEVQQLAYSLLMKWRLVREAERQRGELEARVAKRTTELMHANEQLRREMAERTRVEEELRRAQRLESLGRLAAGLGHEINNPLNFVSGSIEMLDGELPRLRGRIPEDQWQRLEEVVRTAAVGVGRIAQIVGNIKLFSRPPETPAESVDIWKTLTWCVKMIEDRLSPDVELVIDLADVPPVKGKRLEIEQVFINLLENAVQAVTGNGGPAQRIRVSTREDDDSEDVIVEIADTGPGVAPDVADKLFDPFFTTRQPSEGTGLGLAVSHSIITALGGRIDIHNADTGGAVVTVRLPAARIDTLPPAPVPMVPRPQPTGRKARVLVIDDEPLMLRIMAHALREHEVVTVQTGREALDLFGDNPFDVVFCDVMMPGMSGSGFYEALAEAHPGAEQRIIFITGGARGAEAQRFVDRVSNECLEKPIPTDVLRARVNQVLARQGERP
jgi:two-component system, NtrC family, sensor kinase